MKHLIGLTVLLVACSSSPTGPSSNPTLQYADACSRMSHGTGSVIYADGSVLTEDSYGNPYYRNSTTVSCRWAEATSGNPGSPTTHDVILAVVWK